MLVRLINHDEAAVEEEAGVAEGGDEAEAARGVVAASTRSMMLVKVTPEYCDSAISHVRLLEIPMVHGSL